MSEPLTIEVTGQRAPDLTDEGQRRINWLGDALFQLCAAIQPGLVRGAGPEDTALRTVVARHCDTAAGLFCRYQHGDFVRPKDAATDGVPSDTAPRRKSTGRTGMGTARDHVDDMDNMRPAEGVQEKAAAWTEATSGRALLRDVLAAVREEVSEFRQDMRNETLPGIENALSSLTEATEANTAMLERVETAIMQVPVWGVKKQYVPGIGMTEVGGRMTIEGDGS